MGRHGPLPTALALAPTQPRGALVKTLQQGARACAVPSLAAVPARGGAVLRRAIGCWGRRTRLSVGDWTERTAPEGHDSTGHTLGPFPGAVNSSPCDASCADPCAKERCSRVNRGRHR